ncbi:hypothetical protein BGZ76_006177 [Entomortierella beljakovae]|nr:hypothetical protein BGZ76_006177 [Entomortierella beljakovae]
MTASEKKPMQTKNKILIAAISIVVIAGVAVGIYFGVHNKNSDNNSSNNSTSNPTTSSNGAQPTPTGILPPTQNGTMINGTLFPYYNLQGEAPAPVGVAGMVYTNCKVPNTFSISFDDGPSEWTHELLDLLDKENLKVTFFVNGNNQNCIYNPTVQSVLKRAYQSGHQIASHTWSHPKLTTLTSQGVTTEMTRLEQAFLDVLGIVPRYMRPPYGAGTFGPAAEDAVVQGALKNLGYVITTWDIATTDADIDDNNIPHKLTDEALLKAEQFQVTSVVEATPKGANHMELMHDTYMRTVRLLAPWSIKYIKDLGYKIVPVAACLGDEDPRTWYKVIGAPNPNPPTTCTK